MLAAELFKYFILFSVFSACVCFGLQKSKMQYLNGLGETRLVYNLLMFGKQKLCDYSGLTQNIQISPERGTKQI